MQVVQPKSSAKQVELGKLDRAARRATEAAVDEFDKQTRLFKTRANVKRLVIDHIPKYSLLTDIDARTVSIAIAYSPITNVCTATLWFDLSDGTGPNRDRDSARILLAHITAIAISTVFFNQANTILPSVEAKKAANKLSTSIDTLNAQISTETSTLDELNVEIKKMQNKIEKIDKLSLHFNKKASQVRPIQRAMYTALKKKEEIERYISLHTRKITSKREQLRVHNSVIVSDESFFETANRAPQKLAEMVFQTSVKPERVSVTNFPGPMVATLYDPASTQVCVNLVESDSPLATNVLAPALTSPHTLEKARQISNYVIASLLQFLYGYGVRYVGSVDMNSNDDATIRTKICIALDPSLNGPSEIMFDRNGRQWKRSDFKTDIRRAHDATQLVRSNSVAQEILKRFALAIIVQSVDTTILTSDSLNYLDSVSSVHNDYITVNVVGEQRTHVLHKETDTTEFLNWAETELRNIAEFVTILAQFKHIETGVAAGVYKKLVAGKMGFTPDELLYLQFALCEVEPIRDLKTMLEEAESTDHRYDALRQYKSNYDLKKAQRIQQQARSRATRKASKDAEEAEQREMRLPIVKLALFGLDWAKKRKAELNNQMLAYLFGQPEGEQYIKQVKTNSIRADSVYTYSLKDPTDVLDFVNWLKTIASISLDMKALKHELTTRACNAIVQKSTTLDIDIEDYLRYVEQIALPDLISGVILPEALDVLLGSEFARSCDPIVNIPGIPFVDGLSDDDSS